MDSSKRVDRALILARGSSRRMGQPKGVCQVPGSSRTFIASIVDLYMSVSMAVDIITLPDLVQVYAKSINPSAQVNWLPVEGGGDTALSVFRAAATVSADCTHYWAHPVDLPHVQSATVENLKKRSQAHPLRIVRPCAHDTPGHPVILPVAVLRTLAASYIGRTGAQWKHGPMRKLLDHAQRHGAVEPVLQVGVDDTGIYRDYDDPESFHPGDSQ